MYRNVRKRAAEWRMASHYSVTFNVAVNKDLKQISVQEFKSTKKTPFALILILVIHTV